MTLSPTEPQVRSFAPSELALYHRNPRLGSVSDIEDSLRAHGQYKPIVVNIGTFTGRPHEVLAGNHTVKAFRNLQEREPGDPRWRTVHAYLIDVDDDRAERIVLVDNRTSEKGGFDDAMLADMLKGLPDLAGTAYTDDDLAELVASLEGALPPMVDESSAQEEKYTAKVDTPQYEPSGTPPPLSDLMDRTRTEELEAEIDGSGLPQELRDFLRHAAQRHTVIDFRNVADYYAHAPAEVQRLFERQALVIIDINDAIKYGFTRFSETITEIRDADLAESDEEE